MIEAIKNTHFVLSGQAVISAHGSLADAHTAGITSAKTGRQVIVVQLVEEMAPATGVIVTAADGTTSQAQ